MSYKSYGIGIHPAENKHISLTEPIRSCGLSGSVIIPLAHHIGKPAEPVVAVGDAVKAGTLIAQKTGFISAHIHASISGTVKAIGEFPHPLLGTAEAIHIEADGSNATDHTIKPQQRLSALTRDQIVTCVQNAGIVGMGGAAFPTQVKLSPPPDKPIDIFMLNGTECEPYLTCDHMLMLEKADQIIEGMLIVMRLLGTDRGFIALEANKLDVARVFRRALAEKKPLLEETKISVEVLKTQYPHGAEKQLIKAIIGRVVPHKGLPMDVGCVVHNAGTIYAIYEALYYGKPLYERVVTVTGSIVNRPSNLRVRVGTPLQHLIDACDGLKEPAAKVIMGGPMMGFTQYALDVPVMKGTSGIVLLGAREVKKETRQPCIKCAACVDVCPVNILPTDIARFAERNRFESMDEFYPDACIECGNCSYVCPSKIPLVQLIRLAKKYQMQKAALSSKP